LWFINSGVLRMRIGIICGGPSGERGISLNSACSVMDHLKPLGWEIIPFYCDLECNFYRISPANLYSNTPSDFDFKLDRIIRDDDESKKLTKSEFIEGCHAVDIILPVIHGAFGEDGGLQNLLEENNIPFVGSNSKSCKQMFDKIVANRNMANNGFPTLPNLVIEDNGKEVEEFFKNNPSDKYVVKPSASGSSIGVEVVATPAEAINHAHYIIKNKIGGRAMIEPLCLGREFTIVVLENNKNEPVALIPTENHLINGEILSYRHKYLLSRDVEFYCPPHFSDEEIKNIQTIAEDLFTLFNMRDFSRLDGWLFPDGRVVFSDINPISGMEQNSNLFIQGSHVGFTHCDLLKYIITNAARRYGIECNAKTLKKNPNAKQIRVLFGGNTAEREVSVMSGTNVWLKLIYDKDSNPQPYLLTPSREVWQLPYFFALNYTAEEILKHCSDNDRIISRLKSLVPLVCERLGLPALVEKALVRPRHMSLEQFCREASDRKAFVFIALHGGEGEDGRLQSQLKEYHLCYNGSDVGASKLCMDKYETAIALVGLNPDIIPLNNVLLLNATAKDADMLWENSIKELRRTDNITEVVRTREDFDLLIKPRADGSSMGIARLKSAKDLEIYLSAIEMGKTKLDVNTLPNQGISIELPTNVDDFLLEPYVETDKIRLIKGGRRLSYEHRTGWIELTVGVLEENGKYHSMTPSLTVVQDGNVLSLEDKFQGGTGVNLTPPPIIETNISPTQIDHIKGLIELVAKKLGINGYARIDIFFNGSTNKMIVLEANTLPGLTISTVIFHQALAEKTPMYPSEFLSKIVHLGIERQQKEKIGF
jgi:D-alanine--D-alanine ligase